MTVTICRVAGVCTLLGILIAPARAGDWPQFRGPNASGRPSQELPLPERLGPTENVLWKTALPPGHSSPVIHGDRIYLTGVRDQRLVTIALARATGAILWEVEAPHEKLETIHQTGSYAQSSPAADDEVVVSFFGSCGLFCYDRDGRQLWHMAMGPFKNEFGAGSSPILAGDRVILCQDHDSDSFLASIDKRNGKVIWKTDRSEFPRNYCTPVIWENEGRKQIVVAATLRIVGYDFDTGKEVWTVQGVARIVNMTPVIGSDGTLYAACWTPGADPEDRITPPPFDELIGNHDLNNNDAIEESEMPEGSLKSRFPLIDRDKDGHMTRKEYEAMRKVFETARNVVLAIRQGGIGDITDTHVLWQYTRQLPYVPSPLFYRDKLFMVKSGGILNVLDTKNGKPLRQSRLAATGEYFSSPVASDGKVYVLSERGLLSVLDAANNGSEMFSADFQEPAYATPAIVDGRMYLRTNGNLYCFGAQPATE